MSVTVTEVDKSMSLLSDSVEEPLKSSFELNETLTERITSSPPPIEGSDRYQHYAELIHSYLVEETLNVCSEIVKKKQARKYKPNILDLSLRISDQLVDNWINESIAISQSIELQRHPVLPRSEGSSTINIASNEVAYLSSIINNDDDDDIFNESSVRQPEMLPLIIDIETMEKIADSSWKYYQNNNCILDIEQLHGIDELDVISENTLMPADRNYQSHVKIYKHFLFDLSCQVISEIFQNNLSSPNTLMPTKKCQRSVLNKKLAFKKPKHGEEVHFISELVNHLVCNGQAVTEPNKRQITLVQDLLLKEMRDEEPEWIDYTEHEYQVKLETSDSILESLLDESLHLARLISLKRSSSKH